MGYTIRLTFKKGKSNKLVYFLNAPCYYEKKFDKVKYFGKEYFIKGRMSKGGYCVIMNISGETVDFSNMPKGLGISKLANCERVSTRRSCLCISQIRE